MTLKIDHVTIAGARLEQLDNAFANLGLTTDYGGPHSNGITHMSLLGFDDGSYIELISFIPSTEADKTETAFWGRHIAGDGGPCAWAVYVDNVATEAERMANLGVTVEGPHYYNRRRPDGQLVEWDLAFLGDKGAGATLPFIIKDITPRTLRVQPSASVAGQRGQPALLTGVSKVILGVENLQAATNLFQRVYNWPAPQIQTHQDFGASLANFVDTPVTLAAPLAGHPWLAERLARFNESPCAYLIGTRNFETARTKFNLGRPVDWFGRPVAWFDPEKINGVNLGIIG